VPAIIASPWIPKGYVEHEPVGPTPYSHYEHSSVPATLKKMFGMNSFLTKRDAWAGTFEHLFSLRSTPRTDCPLSIPEPPEYKPSHLKNYEYMQKPNDLTKGFAALASVVGGLGNNITHITTEYEAGNFMVEMMEKHLQRKKLTNF